MIAKQATPEQLKAAQEQLQKAEPLFKKIREGDQVEETRWRAELALLEKTTEEFFDLPVDPAHPELTIRVKRLLDVDEMDALLTFNRHMIWAQKHVEKRVEAEKDPDPEDIRKQREAGYQIVELVTINPGITAEWLKSHRLHAQYVGGIIMDFYHNLGEQMKEVAAAASFRKEQGGPGVR